MTLLLLNLWGESSVNGTNFSYISEYMMGEGQQENGEKKGNRSILNEIGRVECKKEEGKEIEEKKMVL